jgi:hypothetical protein
LLLCSSHFQKPKNLMHRVLEDNQQHPVKHFDGTAHERIFIMMKNFESIQ